MLFPASGSLLCKRHSDKRGKAAALLGLLRQEIRLFPSVFGEPPFEEGGGVMDAIQRKKKKPACKLGEIHRHVGSSGKKQGNRSLEEG